MEPCLTSDYLKTGYFLGPSRCNAAFSKQYVTTRLHNLCGDVPHPE